MAKWKLHLLQFVVGMLIMAGITAIWRFADVAMYGESQRSAVDALAAVFMTEWICSKIWRAEDGK